MNFCLLPFEFYSGIRIVDDKCLENDSVSKNKTSVSRDGKTTLKLTHYVIEMKSEPGPGKPLQQARANPLNLLMNYQNYQSVSPSVSQ